MPFHRNQKKHSHSQISFIKKFISTSIMSYRTSTNGNRKAVKGEVKQQECHVCKRNGEDWRVYNDHNFRDTKGRICCPIFVKKMRENCCSKCNKIGHFADHCTAVMPSDSVQEHTNFVKKYLTRGKPATKVAVKTAPVQSANLFAALDESSDEEDKPHPNVTVRKPVSRVAQMDWAAADSDDESNSPRKRLFEMAPCPTCASSAHMYCHKA